jgi:hypothetical protein
MPIRIAPLIQFTETTATELGSGVDAVWPLEAISPYSAARTPSYGLGKGSLSR